MRQVRDLLDLEQESRVNRDVWNVDGINMEQTLIIAKCRTGLYPLLDIFPFQFQFRY